MELKGRRELFCREYLKDLNGTQAALRAGFAESDARTYASRLLAEPEIQERIAELAAGRNEKISIDAQDVLIELLRLLTTDLALAVNEDGTVKSIHDIPLDLRRAIASVEVEETFEWQDGTDEDDLVGDTQPRNRQRRRVWTGQIKKLKFWNKEKAVEMLARHLSLFNDKLNIPGLDDLAKRIVESRERAEPSLV